MTRLLPFTDYSADYLADSLSESLGDKSMKKHLSKRHLWGVISRYGSGDVETAKRNVVKAQVHHENGQIFAYAIEEGSVIIGAASILYDLPLRRQRLALPSRVVRNSDVLGSDVITYGPNVAAWVDIRRGPEPTLSTLSTAYKELAEQDSESWTVEPLRSPWFVRGAIAVVMAEKGEPAYYDDYESSKHLVPKSQLYVGPAEN